MAATRHTVNHVGTGRRQAVLAATCGVGNGPVTMTGPFGVPVTGRERAPERATG